MKVYFKITDIVYEISGDIPEYVGQELAEYLFQEEPEGAHKLYVELKAVETFVPVLGNPVYQGPGYVILEPGTEPIEESEKQISIVSTEKEVNAWNQDREYRIYMDKQDTSPNALYMELRNLKLCMEDCEEKRMETGYLPDIVIQYMRAQNPVMDMHFMELFSIDRALACEQAYIMHACFIREEKGAIVFTAPSGTGKSTQGRLWTEYGGAYIVNGDRCILRREADGSCQVFSLPFCGSSSINHNESAPLRAMVFLAQGKTNVIDDQPSLTLLKKLMSQTTYSVWDPDAMNQVMDLYDGIFRTASVLQYACTPDKGAVDCLKHYLEEKEI